MPRLAVVAVLALLPFLLHADPNSAQRRAAAHLFKVMQMPTRIAEAVDRQMAEQLEQKPALEPFAPTVRTFLERYLTWERLREPYTELYTQTFSADELRELAAFYRTSAGRKLLRLEQTMRRRRAALHRHVLQAHRDELHRMLTERAEELRR